MLTITIFLLICQQASISWSTRLPLEVYELTPAAAAAATATVGGDGDIGSSHVTADDFSLTKHKNLEYLTINAKLPIINETAHTNKVSTAATTKTTATAGSSTTITTTTTVTGAKIQNNIATDFSALETNDNAAAEQLDRRRSRQMLDMLKQQQQQQQQQMLHEKPNHKHGQHSKDVRVLYQVGESEADLPICAPNAVCSKIDLYETPWIERQCRCPEVNHMPNIIIHHHHAHHQSSKENAASPHSNSYAEKLRNYYEREKLLQHKRLLVSEFADKKFESLHLKKLMQKLGAVYEDDLQLQPSDYYEQADNDAVPSIEDLDEIIDNEFPHTPRRNTYSMRSITTNTAHMRHSGHMTHRGKEATTSFIGGCPSGLGIEDGHTIADKTRHYKLCEPVHKLPVCKHFRDYTWTLTTSTELNVTEQIVHCRCPKNSVTYLTKREPAADGSSGYTYLFACSPLTRIRCQRKQPCKLFTVRKRQEFLDEVNINALCQCPKAHHCPSHHTQSGVIPGESFLEDNIQTYSGYCMAND